jgi:hypothetical protein
MNRKAALEWMKENPTPDRKPFPPGLNPIGLMRVWVQFWLMFWGLGGRR